MRKAVLVMCILLLIANLSIVAEQSKEEELRIIDKQIAKGKAQRNWGIGLCCTGVVPVALGIVMLTSVTSAGGGSEPSMGAGIAMIAAIASIGFGAALELFGVILWVDGAESARDWEKKKAEVSIQVRGPDLARGKSLGAISLVFSY